MVDDIPSGYVKIAIENHHFSWENPLLMVIFNSYVKLPEGNQQNGRDTVTFKNDINHSIPQEKW